MTVVLDTTILIDHLRERAEANRALGEAFRGGRPIFASVLTKTELLGGLRPGEHEPVATLFREIAWADVDNGVAERAGELAFRYRRSHPGIEVVDYVIAATAELLGAELWTRNRKHFPMFPSLRDPY